MRKLTMVLFFLNLLNFSLSAGTIFKNGYIISLQGDTIKGYLLEQSSINASKKCIFKSTKDGEKIVYKPDEIAGYRYHEGKYYVSRQIGSNSDQSGESVFMEFFIKGIACIYYYINENGEHFYIEKSPFGLVELSDLDLTATNDKKFESVYRGKLKVIMADCPEIEDEINDTKLNYTSLVKLSKDYHNRVCTSESCIIFEREPTPVKISFGIVAGLTYNKYVFGTELESDYGLGYQAGLRMRLNNILFSNDKLGLSVDLLMEKDSKYTLKPFDNGKYVHITYEGVNYVLNIYPNNYTIPEIDVDLKIINLKIPVIVSYNFDFPKFSIVPGIGITNKFILSSNKEFKIANFEDQYGRTIPPYSIGLVGKIGFELKLLNTRAVCFNFLYEHLTDPFAMNSSLRSMENKYTFQIGYRF